ncbi:NAD(P)H-binding protein [Paenibacillus glacialis]|uniref:NAD(P)-binding domain-containing protein n=1 Tax=Paenibacillus glacialis TaxID=494026 RepID=A0A168MA85_9BACL|nr:NAD(P)H-binding protein [Paenibacillus glacialis]OAB44429.1 hypothetical protein PGLA_07180 [Paenibacillus glacialis]
MIYSGKIAIIGGYGKVGKYLAEHALHAGYTVRLLSRRRHINPKCELVLGNVSKIDDIRTLLEDCDAVINTIGPAKDNDSFFSDTTSKILSVMQELGIHRYITVSGGSLTLNEDKKQFTNRLGASIFRIIFPKLIRDKQREYEILTKSNVNWTLVRLPFIKDVSSSGVIKEDLVDMPGNSISNRDIADFLIKQLNDDSYVNKAPFISN